MKTPIGDNDRRPILSWNFVEPQDGCAEVLVHQETQSTRNGGRELRATLLYVRESEKRQIATSGFEVAFECGQLRRLLLSHHLRVEVSGAERGKTRDRGQEEPAGERAPGKIEVLPFQQVPRGDAHDEEAAEHPCADKRVYQ